MHEPAKICVKLSILSALRICLYQEILALILYVRDEMTELVNAGANNGWKHPLGRPQTRGHRIERLVAAKRGQSFSQPVQGVLIGLLVLSMRIPPYGGWVVR
jgi:hypothetical protein